MKKIIFILWATMLTVGCKHSNSSNLSTLLYSQGNIQLTESSLSRSANYCDNLFYEPSQSIPAAADPSAPVTSGSGGASSTAPLPSTSDSSTLPASGPSSTTVSAGTGGASATSGNTTGSGTRSRFPPLYPSRTRSLSVSALNLASEDSANVFVRFTPGIFTIYSTTGEVLLTGYWSEVNSTSIEMTVNDQSYLVGAYPTQTQQVSLSNPPASLCLTPNAAYNPTVGTDFWGDATGGTSGGSGVSVDNWTPAQSDIYAIDTHYNGTWCYASGFPYELSISYDGYVLWTAFFDQNRSVLDGTSPYLNYTENTVGLYRSYDSLIRFNNGYIPSYDNSGIASEAIVSFADASQDMLRVVYGLDREAYYVRSLNGECSVTVPAEEVARLPH